MSYEVALAALACAYQATKNRCYCGLPSTRVHVYNGPQCDSCKYGNAGLGEIQDESHAPLVRKLLAIYRAELPL